MKHPDEQAIGEAIAAIQSHCGFYNYDLYQQAQTQEWPVGDSNQKPSSTVHMHFHDTVDVAVGNVEGNLNYQQTAVLDEPRNLRDNRA